MRGSNSTLMRNMLYSTIGSLVYQGCLWLMTVLVVVLSDNFENAGVLALAMASGNMFLAIGTYNMRTYQVSDVKGRFSQAEYVALRILTICIAWVIMIPYTLITTDGLSAAVAIIIFLLFKSDECFVDVLYGIDQRGHHFDIIGKSQVIRGLLAIILFAMTIALSDNLLVAFGLLFIGLMAVTVAYDVKQAKSLCDLRPQFSKGVLSALIIECLPIAVSPLLTSMIVSVPRQFFSHLYGIEKLGIYATVATPAVLIQAAARYLYMPLLVPLARLKEERGMNAYAKTVMKTMGAMALIVAVAVPIVSAVGSYFLPLVYGVGIIEYTYLFPPVLLGTALIAIFWFLTDALIICRDVFGQLIASGIAFICSAILMGPLEVAFNMNGINITIILSVAAGIVSLGLRLKWLVRMPDEASRVR